MSDSDRGSKATDNYRPAVGNRPRVSSVGASPRNTQTLEKFLKRKRDVQSTDEEVRGKEKIAYKAASDERSEGTIRSSSDTRILPEKGQGTEGEMADRRIFEMLKDMQESLKEVKKTLGEAKTDRQTIKEEIEKRTIMLEKKQEKLEEKFNEMNARLTKVEEQKTEVGGLMERLNWLEKSNEMREKRERKNNIVIKGWEVPIAPTLAKAVENMLKAELDIETQITEARWIGMNGTRGRMVTATLQNWEEKRNIMAKKSKLKGRKMFIDNDLTREERNIQRQILALAATERENRNVAKVGYRKLTVNGTVLVWKDGQGLRETFFQQTELCKSLSNQTYAELTETGPRAPPTSAEAEVVDAPAGEETRRDG